MKNFLIVISALFLLSGGLAWAGPTVTHHDLQLTLIPGEHRLEGVDVLTVKPEGSSQLPFSLSPTAEVLGVTTGGSDAHWKFSEGFLIVDLPAATARELPVEIRYRASFAEQPPALPLNTENPGYGITGAIGPEGAFLGGDAGWYPDLQDSRPTFRLQVKTPPEMTAVTSGRRIAESPGSSIWQTDYPVRGLALAAGPYRVQAGHASEVPVFTFFYPASEKFAGTYLTAAENYLALYRQLFGFYPFSKFAVAENFFPTGYGFPSWTLLGSTVVQLPFIVRTSLGHEIAHSWWGNGIWVDYSRGNWSEGLTTYVADHLYKEQQGPEEAREYRLNILRDYAVLVPPEKDFPLSEFVSRTTAAQQAVGYGKAAMVFHMARKRVGDQAFWAGLRQVAREKLFHLAGWEDFAKALGQTGGTNLHSFFHQWVDRAGAPQLSLSDVRQEKSGNGWVVTGNLCQQPPLYDLRVPVRLETETGPVLAVITAATETSSFRLEAPGRPQRLVVDPDVDIFRRLELAEIPPTVNSLRGSTSLLAIAADGLPAATLEAARMLLPAMGQSEVQVRPESRVSPGDLRGHDLLYLGMPTKEELRPALPAGLSVGAREFVLQGKHYAGDSAVLFAALPHPSEAGRVSGLFLPGSRGAAAVAVRKIPHYGKYSYLVFTDGTNVAKGIWPAPYSPLVHTFAEQSPTQ